MAVTDLSFMSRAGLEQAVQNMHERIRELEAEVSTLATHRKRLETLIEDLYEFCGEAQHGPGVMARYRKLGQRVAEALQLPDERN